MAITLLRGHHRECATGADQKHQSGASTTLDPDLLTRTSWTDAHTALLQIKKVPIPISNELLKYGNRIRCGVNSKVWTRALAIRPQQKRKQLEKMTQSSLIIVELLEFGRIEMEQKEEE